MKIKLTNLLLIIFIIISLLLSIALGYTIMKLNRVKVVNINKKVSIVENSISDSVAKSINAVVVIETYRYNRLIASGTGFIYKKDQTNGYILTNNHVIANGTSYKLILNNHDVVTATFVGGDELMDIAVLKIEASDVLQKIALGDSKYSDVGDTVFTIGAPKGSEYIGTVTKGILSGKNRMIDMADTNGVLLRVLQTDAAINPGNSGGPLLNVDGEVIGINSMKVIEDEIEGMGFAIPIEDILPYLKYLEAGEAIVRPYVGIGLIDLEETYTISSLGISVDPNIEYGVVVGQIYNNSPASASNLKTGDVIIKLDDQKIKYKSIFRYFIYKYNVGDEVKITYLRNNKEYTTKVKLVKQP